MDLNTITVSDFKTLFSRDFAYLPVWSNTTTYNANAIVYYIDGLFYKSLINGNTSTPGTDITKWIEYDTTVDDYVLDSDITKAFAEAQVVFNQELFNGDPSVIQGYLYLTAHYLVNDLNTANAGIQSVGSYPVSGRKVGSVSENYEIPKYYLDNPLFLFYNKTGYGQKYLSFILPVLVGNVGIACGTTLP